jgi:hypothetical protein
VLHVRWLVIALSGSAKQTRLSGVVEVGRLGWVGVGGEGVRVGRQREKYENKDEDGEDESGQREGREIDKTITAVYCSTHQAF